MGALKVWDPVLGVYVEIGGAGPVGPAGPTGPAGPAGGTYHHVQSLASTTWTIDHGLGRHPNISLLDSADTEIEGAIVHTTLNQAVVTLGYAVSGTADCA